MASLSHPRLADAAARSPVVARARIYGAAGHASIAHVRKYSQQPYHVHTEAVADLVAAQVDDDEVIAAALLHDLVEDVPGYTVARISADFGDNIGQLVADLTDIYTKETHPELNRRQRKARERQRLSAVSDRAKLIKLADLVDNSRDIVKHDETFARVYLREKDLLLRVLRVPGSTPHETLHEMARAVKLRR